MFLFLFSTSVFAQGGGVDRISSILGPVYGPGTNPCVQKTVSTTGANRVGPFDANKLYVVYGYDSTDISAGDAIRCIWGDKSIDVNGLGTYNGLSLVGKVIPANQQESFFVDKGKQYISCISKTASRVYDVCVKDPPLTK